MRRRRGRRRGAKDLNGGAEKKRRGDRTAAIKYNYFPIEWKLFGNERRVIGDIHTFIKRFSFPPSGCLHPLRSIHPSSITPLRLAPLSSFSFFLLSFSFFFFSLSLSLSFFFFFFFFLLQRRSEMYSRHSRQIKPSATILFHCPFGWGGDAVILWPIAENVITWLTVCRDANNNDMSTV